MVNIDEYPYDENGKEHGEWLCYNVNDILSYRWNFVHGVRHGLQEGFYTNSDVRYRGYRNMGKRERYWYYYGEKKYYLCLI